MFSVNHVNPSISRYLTHQLSNLLTSFIATSASSVVAYVINALLKIHKIKKQRFFHTVFASIWNEKLTSLPTLKGVTDVLLTFLNKNSTDNTIFTENISQRIRYQIVSTNV